MKQRLLALYGLKHNPFSPEIPVESLYKTPQLEDFCWRIEHILLKEGGFALISGVPGTGKSAALRILHNHLSGIRDVQLGVVTHPSANISDFYRELGDIFGVALSGNNRWGGFKNLREKWLAHLNGTLLRPVLFIDEAQEMPVAVLSELRMLASMQFDSRVLLSIILAGDQRLTNLLSCDELLPLGSRIRARLHTDYVSIEHLQSALRHLLSEAGNPSIMTAELMQTLCEHAMGNYRVLCTMAGELLATAAQKDLLQMDEKLYFDCFSLSGKVGRKKSAR